MTSDRRVIRSNCIAWAVVRYAVLVRAWWRDGAAIGQEPGLRIRCSRLEPRQIGGVKVPHFEVEHYHAGQWIREGWTPLDESPLPWWLLWRAIWAKGYVKVQVLNANSAS